MFFFLELVHSIYMYHVDSMIHIMLSTWYNTFYHMVF